MRRNVLISGTFGLSTDHFVERAINELSMIPTPRQVPEANRATFSPRSCLTIMRCQWGLPIVLSSEEKAHLHALVIALSQRDEVVKQHAEEELLYWCLSSKDALELLKRQKCDVSLSGRARYKIASIIAVETIRKRKMRLCSSPKPYIAPVFGVACEPSEKLKHYLQRPSLSTRRVYRNR